MAGLVQWHAARVQQRAGVELGHHRLQPLRRCQFVLGQTLQQFVGGALEEAGRKLMQQAANLVGRIAEKLGFKLRACAQRTVALQRVLERARQLRQFGKTHRGRAAGQRVRQRHSGFAHRLLEIERPFGDLGDELPRQLVSFGEIDVEKSQADAQGADPLELLVV